jgi:hypothetical protein
MPHKGRSKPARTAFETKVNLLESWVRAESIPLDAPPLSAIKDVQAWVDPAQGLTSWTSYSVAAPGGENADLRARLDAVLPLVQRLRAGESGKLKKPRRGKTISQIQVERERDRLAVQNEELLSHCEVLQGEVTRSQQLVILKEKEYRELLVKFNKLVPFGKA